MKLDKKDRLILYNQFLILEKLYPENAAHYAENRQAVEDGFELHYKWMTDFLTDGLTEEQCEFVLDTLSMHRALHQTVQNLGLTDEMKTRVQFKGFDGNAESEYLSYTQFIVLTLGKFAELKPPLQPYVSFNSHMPSVDMYNRMLNEWRKSQDKWDLTADEVNRILDAQRA